jgi:hypothetical protein
MMPVAAVAGIVLGMVALVGQLWSDAGPIWWLRFSNGLLAAAPVLLLGFVRVNEPEDERRAGRGGAASVSAGGLLWLVITAYVAAYILVAPERIALGGIHWGCRFVLSVYPLLGVLAGVAIARWWRDYAADHEVARTLVVGVVALSVLAQVHSLRLLYARKAFVRSMNAVVASRPEQIVVTNTLWLPMDLSRCMYNKTIFFARQPEDLGHLRDLMGSAAGMPVLFITDVQKPLGQVLADAPGAVLLPDGSLHFSPVVMVTIRLEEFAPAGGGE